MAYLEDHKWMISRVTILITHFKGLITPLITAARPGSDLWGLAKVGFRGLGFGVWGFRGLGVSG